MLIVIEADIISAGTAKMTKRYGFIYVDYDDYGKRTEKLLFKLKNTLL
ncbi:hypothetical protein [Tetragenococcus halophilus]|nr:hypothetical protein [Tetragenococcus halophilus]GLL52332.1 hypothetical protein YA5_023110 [Tetragenococcus halophilus]GMG64781.1 hypothetical protein TEHAL1_22570 [Tetragenococcus halophilus]